MKTFLGAFATLVCLSGSVLFALPSQAGGGSAVRNGKKATNGSAEVSEQTATPAPSVSPTPTPAPAPAHP